MILRQNRVLSILAATSAALALGAAPALAGENDDGDEEEGMQVAPAQSSDSSSAIVPQGGVATGAGGVAEQGTDALLLGLGSGALVLMATGGGLVAVARRGDS